MKMKIPKNISLRAYLAAHAPEPDADDISMAKADDRQLEEKHRIQPRTYRQIKAQIRVQHADALMQALELPVGFDRWFDIINDIEDLNKGK
jgi:hypothetical protein